MNHVCSLMTLLMATGVAHASLIYELTPTVYTATPGQTIQTYATVANTGPEVLYYAYSFVDPGTVPVAGVTGQLPPPILYPGDSVLIVGATITTSPEVQVGAYTFTEGVGYHPELDVAGVIEASDRATLLVVPEPTSLPLGCAFLLGALTIGSRRNTIISRKH